ncbi:hypothetical protein CRG98_020790 [Punica granatum]|uniref:Major facilitator superfamily (MFS) profile domain-containing protein n=1 Tax=Punica granatum TaxID=22663 RepID=A0A2I0JSD4_PUNGR|nr:hypothetical protein CRG98_020790 [Punica granatum]
MGGVADYTQKGLNLSDIEIEIINGMINSMSLVGSFMACRTSNYAGRRYNILIARMVFFVSTFLMDCATNFAFLPVGRIVAGTGTGMSLPPLMEILTSPLYTAEVAPASARGFLTSFPEKNRRLGIVGSHTSPLDSSAVDQNSNPHRVQPPPVLVVSKAELAWTPMSQPAPNRYF